MRLSTAQSRILGVQIGEASLNRVDPSQRPLKAKIILLSKEGDGCGYTTVSDWSQKVMDAFEQLCSAMEEDVIAKLFEEEIVTSGNESSSQELPPQF